MSFHNSSNSLASPHFLYYLLLAVLLNIFLTSLFSKCLDLSFIWSNFDSHCCIWLLDLCSHLLVLSSALSNLMINLTIKFLILIIIVFISFLKACLFFMVFYFFIIFSTFKNTLNSHFFIQYIIFPTPPISVV